jgi:dihydrofolate reductase|tara:strand:- start:10767 stop:11276 length:510 start_codon:yes stop_codon:yes gene_type:complete
LIKAILACDDYGGVSKNGTLPWPNNSTDLQWFKNNTAGHVVVMGSTTWDDPHMPRPLPKRTNVLVTSREADYPGANHYINGDLTTQLKELEARVPGIIVWVIGGPNIIEQSLGVIEEFYISRIPGAYACDTFLPLRKIESLFERRYVDDTNKDVTFEIWNKRETNETVS